MTEIDEGFIKTAYQRNGIWYPAPFGDLTDEPLFLQNMCYENKPDNNAAIVKKAGNIYCITAKPLGLNHHVPKESYTIKIINGYPENFIFYTGYSNKYKNLKEEMEDLLDDRRLESLYSW